MPPWAFGPFVLDVSERRLLRDGLPVSLTPKAFDLLCVLVMRHGHLVMKEQLLEQVWPDTAVEEASLNRCVSVLRKALGDGVAGQRYIETVPKRGYRFVATAMQLPPVAPAAEAETPAPPTPTAQPGAAMAQLAARSTDIGGVRRGLMAVVVLLIAAVLAYATFIDVREGRTLAASKPTPVHRQVTFGATEGSPSISPDGRRIAYVSADSDSRRLVVQELPGGSPVTIFTSAEMGGLRWSPDGSEILFFTRDAGPPVLHVLPREGGTPRRVSSGQFVACWSPDGRQIAVAQFLAGRILIVDVGGGARRSISLTGAKRWIGDLDWSAATGLLLAVGNDTEGRTTIWTIRPDGTDQREIVVEHAEITGARWAPRGDAIYYFRRVEQTNSLLKIPFSTDARPAVASSSPILTGLEVDGTFSISSTGTLVYARAPFHSNLWTVHASGTASAARLVTTQLTHGTSLVERPRVSPDGRRVLFNVGHPPRANLFSVAVTGGVPKALTARASFNAGGAWSADGRSVAFASTEGGKPRVWLVGADGGTAHPISSGNLSDSFDVSWSPTAQVLYQQAGNRNFYVLDPATGAERMLIADASRGWVFSPTYAPDGARIAVAWSRGSDSGLWVIDTRESSPRRVYDRPLMPIGWSADGKDIYAVDGTRAAYRGLATYLGETLTKAQILKISADGSAKVVFDLPFPEVGGIAMVRSGERFEIVCAVYTSRSDVWIVDDFDE